MSAAEVACIDCDICRQTAPIFFVRDDSMGASYVLRQPVSEEEILLAEEAMDSCPTNTIGNDG